MKQTRSRKEIIMGTRRKKLKKLPICCGQNFKDWIGYKIVDVQSNKLDLNVRVKLMNESGRIVKLFFNDLDFDGDTLFYTESDSEPSAIPTR
ncbi:hypothetical protein [Blautia glucerasea]|uniref:hypothetical protein n=1 Tax=Blautia glucerasea TaxID=536633 RepID=UPI001D096721|nr:hypothetical protein [Blautia glucerasea]MCB6544026.1 hypothetical protein [Blautia glucerasea]